jgi:UDP-2-acetamido-2,6-beta-L-arabino-hexul-4-ose reductase
MNFEPQRIAVTGANGFLGTNLVLRLSEEGHDVRTITRGSDLEQAEADLASADVIFHVAGANRPENDTEYLRSNRDYSAWVADAVAEGGRNPLIVYSSSAKALEDSDYGRSKRAGEQILLQLAEARQATVSVWRLPNLCGKWGRPNYNSVVATFCHNAARGLPLRVDDPTAPLSLLYIDDLVEQWLPLITDPPKTSGMFEPQKVYRTTIGELAEQIQAFADSRSQGAIPEVGTGLARALYATFIAALPAAEASYPLRAKTDARGSFVEVLKTPAAGQFSYFTAHPGVTRGGHYHHTKIEKFLVAHGTGRFRFRHVLSGEFFELVSTAGAPLVIETIPGWAHDVTNVGNDELVVLSWANEQFDPAHPDTYPMPL